MTKWRALLVVASAAAALAIGLGAQAGSPHGGLQAWLNPLAAAPI